MQDIFHVLTLSFQQPYLFRDADYSKVKVGFKVLGFMFGRFGLRFLYKFIVRQFLMPQSCIL